MLTRPACTQPANPGRRQCSAASYDHAEGQLRSELTRQGGMRLRRTVVKTGAVWAVVGGLFALVTSSRSSTGRTHPVRGGFRQESCGQKGLPRRLLRARQGTRGETRQRQGTIEAVGTVTAASERCRWYLGSPIQSSTARTQPRAAKSLDLSLVPGRWWGERTPRAHHSARVGVGHWPRAVCSLWPHEHEYISYSPLLRYVHSSVGGDTRCQKARRLSRGLVCVCGRNRQWGGERHAPGRGPAEIDESARARPAAWQTVQRPEAEPRPQRESAQTRRRGDRVRCRRARARPPPACPSPPPPAGPAACL